jgi:hypothetical protein
MHLNGLAYHKCLDNLTPQPIQDLRVYFLEHLVVDYFDNHSGLAENADHINFAWETTHSPVSQYAKTAIENSKNIVIIGYSFPLYNRLADLNFLNEKTLIEKNVFIQDPEEGLLETFSDSFSILPKSKSANGTTSVKLITSCKSFYVPKDFFINLPA